MEWWPYERRGRTRRVLLAASELEARLEEERMRSDRTSLPLSVILCDVAALAGRLGGPADYERFLDELGGMLGAGTRRVDAKGWYGTGRVAVLLPATAGSGAAVVLERLQAWVGRYLAGGAGRQVAADVDGLFEVATYPDAVRRLSAANGQARPEAPDRAALLFAGGRSLKGRSRALKRAFDVAGALLLLVAALPLMLVAALAARLSSPGPALFRQVRLGEAGRPFLYYKLRSMYVGNDDAAHRDYTRRLIAGEVRTINNGGEGELLLKLAADPRVTSVGRWLRRSSLDELPQLFNVLKGDMSLVGPRPPLPYEVNHYRHWHLRRILSAKPGLTGLWQVRSRSSSSFDEMVRMDLRYADTWSLWGDLRILAQTVPAVLSAKGAY